VPAMRQDAPNRSATATRSLDVQLVAIGTHGDVLPFLQLGRELRARGHEVTVFANGYHADWVRRLSLGYFEVGTADEYLAAVSNADTFHPIRGLRVLAELMARINDGIYREIVERNVPGRTVTAGACTAFAARIAQEKHGIPMVSVNLQPTWYFSADDPPVMNPRMMWLKSAPRWCRRLANALADRVMDRSLGVPVREFRSQLGLPPFKKFSQWWFSTQAVVGLFPEWYAGRQPDWPAHFEYADFPLYDGVSDELSDEVETFLADGPPPIVFTPGSGSYFVARFIEAAADACRRLGRRGMILSNFGDTPAALPAGVRRFRYVPLGPLLKRAAGLVHHGGIGTMARALRAGIPHVVTPMAYDQPDNAVRLARMGVARWVPAHAVSGRRLAAALDDVLHSPAVAAACRRYAAMMPSEPSLESVCRTIERIA